MTIADMILYLRQQLITLRSENNRETVAELLATFKMLTKAAFDSGDQELVALLVDLTDSTRDLYMGKPLNGHFPSEEKIRNVAKQHTLISMAGAPPIPAQSPELTTQQQTLKADEPAHKAEDTQPLKQEDIQQAIEAAETERTQQRDEVMHKLAELHKHNWQDYTAIRDGSPQQMRAYSTVFDELAIFMRLKEHNPMWVGTYPINLDIPGSDIDIIFSPPNLRKFIADARNFYTKYEDFKVVWKPIKQVPTIIVRFQCAGFLIELFAQPKPTTHQDAYIHMRVEARLLAIGDQKARNVIRELKGNGTKTEPAFANYFGIEGDDPYQQLLHLSRVSDETLMKRYFK
jgi:hypothetical protein